jgi:hypothetical protein
MTVLMPVRSIVSENPPVVSRKQVEIDEGEVIADDRTFCILPHFLANRSIPGDTANCGNLIGNLDGLAELLACRSIGIRLAQMRFWISYLLYAGTPVAI